MGVSADGPEPLPGGFVNAVVRVGDTVRRPVPPSGGFVRDLLRFLEHRHWPGAPRHLGFDELGREILTFLAGHVAWEEAQPAEVRSDESLVAVARLVRQLHDLTAGTDLAGDQEVVCHNDLSLKNTVYRDLGEGLRPVAFIDWDLAAPGSRVHDVAHVCWQFVGLGPGMDVGEAARRVRLIADAYGLRARGELIRTVLWWQDRCWRGIEAGAVAGEPAMMRLRALGAVNEVRGAYQWTAEHHVALERAML
ncbi:phosphotransferase [Plantactinospora sp. S1510]|uniref:Phosphotransferase n=1 Tax=Plantactinospora alkalitolerans TaxID=2789879 RepID=A0ABS0GVY0_9ACTN|nr:phosphotransferase [Plantactinospora alkalitolerans]